MVANQGAVALTRKKIAREQRDKRLRSDRGPVMRMVIDLLDKDRRDLAWLADQIGRSRQAVSAWDDVPERHEERVAEILGIPVSKIRRQRP